MELQRRSASHLAGHGARTAAVLQRKCACGSAPGLTGECQECRQNRRHHDGAHSPGLAPASVHDALRAPGQPLSAADQELFSARFGHDFSRVRIHADDLAAQSARDVSAQAYTVGSHIAFAAGRYAPETTDGRRLLAHELAHTLQQQETLPASVALSESASREVEADRLAQSMDRGGAVPSLQAGTATLARKEEAADKAKAPECPKTHTIADDVYDAIGAAWKKSGHGGDTVAEQGGRIVTDSGGKRVIRTGAGGSGSISLPEEKAGDTTLGTFHTHPYSKGEGSELGVSFSGGDISNFVAGGQGSAKYIGAGSCYFVLDTLDQTQKDACKKVDLEKRWNDQFAKASGSFQKKVESAVKTTIAGCGLCYYRACRPNAKSAVPKTASLA